MNGHPEDRSAGQRERSIPAGSADLAPDLQTRALRQVGWVYRITPVAAVLAAVVWVAMSPTLTLEDGLREAVLVFPSAVALLLIWRAVQAGQRGDLGQLPVPLRQAGWALLIGSLLELLSIFWLSTGELPADVPWWVGGFLGVVALPLSSLPGLGLLVLARVMQGVFLLRQDEELTV